MNSTAKIVLKPYESDPHLMPRVYPATYGRTGSGLTYPSQAYVAHLMASASAASYGTPSHCPDGSECPPGWGCDPKGGGNCIDPSKTRQKSTPKSSGGGPVSKKDSKGGSGGLGLDLKYPGQASDDGGAGAGGGGDFGALTKIFDPIYNAICGSGKIPVLCGNKNTFMIVLLIGIVILLFMFMRKKH